VGDHEIGFNKQGASMEQLVMRHLSKLSDISCQELTPSYTEKRPIKVGEGMMLMEKYHPDLREAYSNGVDFLLDIVLPYADEKFEVEFKDLNEQEDNEFEEIKKENKKSDDWLRVKMKLRRKLLGKIMLMLYRVDFFANADRGVSE